VGLRTGAAGAGILIALTSPIAAQAASQSFAYTVSHSLYGQIGTYVRTVQDADGVTSARSQMRISVKVAGLVLHREVADQVEAWRGPRLISFQSVTTIDGKPLRVHGEARDNRFMVTTPQGTTAAPGDVAASDPWAFHRMGAAVIVSIKTGLISAVNVTGGEPVSVLLHGVQTPARLFHVKMNAQPNKFEVWLDARGFPIKFRSQEPGGAVEFTLATPRVGDGTKSLAMAAPHQMSNGF
jgi:hypothetical protein